MKNKVKGVFGVCAALVIVGIAITLAHKDNDAQYREQLEMYERLYGETPRPHGKDSITGNPHIYQVAENGFDHLMIRMLDEGADPNALTPSGYTPITLADYACAKILIEYGADINREWVMHERGYALPMSVLLVQFARPWNKYLKGYDDPQGEAIRKVQLLIDHGVKFKHKISAYASVARSSGNHRLAEFVEKL